MKKLAITVLAALTTLALTGYAGPYTLSINAYNHSDKNMMVQCGNLWHPNLTWYDVSPNKGTTVPVPGDKLFDPTNERVSCSVKYIFAFNEHQANDVALFKASGPLVTAVFAIRAIEDGYQHTIYYASATVLGDARGNLNEGLHRLVFP